MKPVYPNGGGSWSTDNANQALKAIRAQCRRELTECGAAQGRVPGKVTKTRNVEQPDEYTSVVTTRTMPPGYDGAELNAMIQSRWQAFCSEPQSCMPVYD